LRIKNAELVLEGIFTHHRSADELTSEWFWQKKNFGQIKEKAQKLSLEFGFKTLRFHSSISAALLRESNFDEDMARVGIAAYGCLEPACAGV
jgi:alanine racemase